MQPFTLRNIIDPSCSLSLSVNTAAPQHWVLFLLRQRGCREAGHYYHTLSTQPDMTSIRCRYFLHHFLSLLNNTTCFYLLLVYASCREFNRMLLNLGHILWPFIQCSTVKSSLMSWKIILQSLERHKKKFERQEIEKN